VRGILIEFRRVNRSAQIQLNARTEVRGKGDSKTTNIVQLGLDVPATDQIIFGTDFHTQIRKFSIPKSLVSDLNLVVEFLKVAGCERIKAGKGLKDNLFTRTIKGNSRSVLVNRAFCDIISYFAANLEITEASSKVGGTNGTTE
jgi:hypothetical protein